MLSDLTSQLQQKVEGGHREYEDHTCESRGVVFVVIYDKTRRWQRW